MLDLSNTEEVPRASFTHGPLQCCGRQERMSMSKCGITLTRLDFINVPTIYEWLRDMRIESLISTFVEHGYENIEYMFIQALSPL